MLYYFKKGKNTTETQVKICLVYEEGAVTDQTCKSALQSFTLETSRWMMCHVQVEVDSNQIDTLIENSQHYTMQDIADIPKIIEINKVIGENEKRVFYFMEKTKWTFWPIQ